MELTQSSEMGKHLSTKETTKSRAGIKIILRSFCDRSTIHGLGQIVERTFLVAKLFWILAFFGALGFVCFHISELIRQYLERPVFEKSYLSQKPIQFPAVTVCNLDPFSRSAYESLLADDKSRLNQYFNKLATLKRKNLVDDDMQATMLDQMSIRMNIGFNESRYAGHKAHDLILRCKFMGQLCNVTTQFKHTLNIL